MECQATPGGAVAQDAAAVSADPTSQLAAERWGRLTAAAGNGAIARAHFERALELAKQVDSPANLSRVAYDYAQVLEEQGDPTQALSLYRQAYQARQAVR